MDTYPQYLSNGRVYHQLSPMKIAPLHLNNLDWLVGVVNGT